MVSLVSNPNTVLKASRELKTKGRTAGRPGQGTFIEDTLGPGALAELTALRRTSLHWKVGADSAGLGGDGIVSLFASILSKKTQIRATNRHCVMTPYGHLQILWEFTMAWNPGTRLCRRRAAN